MIKQNYFFNYQNGNLSINTYATPGSLFIDTKELLENVANSSEYNYTSSFTQYCDYDEEKQLFKFSGVCLNSIANDESFEICENKVIENVTFENVLRLLKLNEDLYPHLNNEYYLESENINDDDY